MIAIFINIFSWIIKLWLNYDEDLEHCLLTKDSQTSTSCCPKCGSYHGKPKRQCKDCGQPFVINPTNKTVSDETKQLIDKLLLERIYLRGIARVTGVSWSWLQNYVNNKLASVPRQVKVSDKSKGKLVRECDEMWSLVFSKTIKVYIWRLIDRKTREIIGGYARR